MEIQLIDGRFTPQEAETLLTELFRTKMEFHERRIRSFAVTEEDIERSEKKIADLQNRLNHTIRKIKQSGKDYTDLQAHIEIRFMPVLTP